MIFLPCDFCLGDRRVVKQIQNVFLSNSFLLCFLDTGSSLEDHQEVAYDRLTLSSLSSVFVTIGAATAVSLLILIIEWIVACITDIDPMDPRKPSGFVSAFRQRWTRLSEDARKRWIPFQSASERWFIPGYEIEKPLQLKKSFNLPKQVFPYNYEVTLQSI